MPTVLITGANRGLGLEFVKQYAADAWNVIACCRVPEKAKELQILAKTNTAIRIEKLDVIDDQNIASLADSLQNTAIDVLINNAGIFSGTGKNGSNFPDNNSDSTQNFGTIDTSAWATVLRVNTIAPIKVTEAFVSHLKSGALKTIINITSSMGGLKEMGGGSIAYRSSKTALNSAMRVIAHDLRNFGLTIVNIHPGWVKTDMGGAYANMAPEQSVKHIRQTIATLQPHNSGEFLNYDGQPLPW